MAQFPNIRIGARYAMSMPQRCRMRSAGGAVALLFLLSAPLRGQSSFGGPHPPPDFHLESVADDREQLECRFAVAQMDLLAKLNRTDRGRIATLGKIVVPDRWELPETAYSPLPRRFTWAAYFSKAVVVSKRLQAFAAYENGHLVRWGPVSTGAAGNPTPDGLFHLNWRSKGRRSTVNPNWFLKWYFNFSNKRGHSFHEYELPGLPASHGCVRMLGRDARWMYDWGDSWELEKRGRKIKKRGTPVLIIGAYDHAADKPWLTAETLDLEAAALPGEAFDLAVEALRAWTGETSEPSFPFHAGTGDSLLHPWARAILPPSSLW